MRAADEAVAEARGGWRPSVNASGSYGGEHTDIINFGPSLPSRRARRARVISQPVLTGGQAYAQIQSAVALVRASRADLLNAEQQVLLAAATAYMDVVRDVIALRLHEDRRPRPPAGRHQDTIGCRRSHQDRSSGSGGAPRGVACGSATAQAQINQSRDTFERVIGRPAETLEDAPPLPGLPGTQEQALALALQLSPRIQSAQANDKAAQYGVDNAVGAMLPHASIVAQYDYTQNSLASQFGPYGQSGA